MDSRGFLWFCTVEGVSRFDGTTFVNFRVEDGLPDRHVNDVLETFAGEYLIATDKGLARLNPKGAPRSETNPLFTVFVPDEPQARSIGILFQSRDGNIWAGTPNGLYRIGETAGGITFQRIQVEEFTVIAIIQDRSGVVWSGGESGKSGMIVRMLSDGTVEKYSNENGLPNSQIASLLETSDGKIWAGLRPGEKDVGLLRFVADPTPEKQLVERRWTINNGLPTYWIPSLYQSSDGKMWLGTTAGLCQWQGDNAKSVCQTYVTKNDLCDWSVDALIEDKDANLWAATHCGVKKMARHGFTIYGEADKLENPFVTSIFKDSIGEIFVSAIKSQLSISRFGERGFTTIRPRIPPQIRYFGWGWKQLAWQDSTGSWWIPTGQGLFRSAKNTRFENLDRSPFEKIQTGARSSEIFRLFEDSHGDIWIATIGSSRELLRWRRLNGVWENLTQESGFSTSTIGSVFAEDKDGNLWIATGSDQDDSRLIRFRNGHFKTFSEADGSPKGWTRDLYVDDRGRLWLANTAMGLLRLDNVNTDKLDFVRYSIGDGLSSSAVYCVTGDAFGRIYAGTGRGLDRLDPESGEVENFTTADGLPASDVELAYRDSKDSLWFGTPNGLVHYQPTADKPRVAPTVLITNVVAGGHSQPVSILGESNIADLDLASNENQVSVGFIGLGATLGEKLNFEYRVTGKDWTPTDERTLNFANLSPGSYRFEVRAVSADRLTSEPSIFLFNIAAPIWQRWWFMLIVSLAAATFVYLVYRARIQRLLELERVRTRIATDLHDDIGANLTRISILSEVARQKAQNGNGQMLSSIAEIARESVASMNDIVWAVSPKHDSLPDLVTRMRRHAEEVFALRDIGLRLDVPDAVRGQRLGVGVRRDLLLIFKEAVNNAARHSDCTEVWIELVLERAQLVMRVSDNGRAFNLDDIDGDGYGIDSMQRRATAIGADLSIESEQGKGTTIILRSPLFLT